MRFAKAKPPPALRVLARATEELSQERGELFHGALESLSWKETPEQRILFHAGIKHL
jgi:hypothetical protein